jgi:hypothetical protein
MLEGRRGRASRRRLGLTVAALAALTAGCADLTSGGATGDAEAYLAGDEPSSAASGSAQPGRSSGSAPPSGAALREPLAEPPSAASTEANAAVEATVTVGLQVFLDGGAEGSVELTSGVQTQTVPAQGAAATKIAEQRVAAGVYTRARVIFTRVEADVRSGLVIGGVPIVGIVRVSASAQDPIVVERQVQIEVREEGTAQLLVDLNAPVWLATASPGGNAVSRTAFAGAVELRRR